MEKIKNYALKNSKNFIALALVYSVLCVFFPLGFIYYRFFEWETGYNILFIAFKVVFSVLPLLFFISLKTKIHPKSDAFSWLVLGLIFVICINNFPFFTILEKFGYLTKNLGLWINHIFRCFAVSIFEELIFRGVIFSLLFGYIFKNDKFKNIKSILISSALFSLIHIANIFSGEEWYFVLLQMSYSFLMGGLFCVAYIISGKLLIAIILHFIYNFGGLLQDNGVIFGGLWSSFQTIETYFVSIIFGLIILIYIYKKYFKDIKNESSCSKS